MVGRVYRIEHNGREQLRVILDTPEDRRLVQRGIWREATPEERRAYRRGAGLEENGDGVSWVACGSTPLAADKGRTEGFR